MTSERPISRRALLRAMAASSIVAALAACGVNVTPPPTPSSGAHSFGATGRSPVPTAQVPTLQPSTSPAPSPSAASDPAALRRKIARLLMVGFRGLEIGPDDTVTKALAAGLGGVILFDRDQTTGGQRNIASPSQLAKLTAALRAAAPGPILIGIDQEGGKVSRLNPAKGFPPTRTQAVIGATGDPGVARAAGEAMGSTMRAAGIDLDLAPVVDVNVNPKNPAIGALGRSFSGDPAVVAAMAEAEIRGLHAAGVRSVVKHFPGLGSAAANTDFAVVDVTTTWKAAELDPYRALIRAGVLDAVMTGDIVNRMLDPDGVPASLSAPMILGTLRGELGWNGPVVTDDLGAVAITSRYSQPDAIARALGAGNDLLVFANQARYVPDLADRLVDTIANLVAAGHVTEARIDASIARLDMLMAPPASG